MLKEKLVHIKQQQASFLIANIFRQVRTDTKTLLFNSALSNIAQPSEHFNISYNSLSDLLQYKAKGSLMPRWEFLNDAMQRFEMGQSVYTICEGECLMACIWRDDNVLTKNIEVPPDTIQPSETTVLKGVYYHPDARNRLGALLLAISKRVIFEHKRSQIYAFITTKDTFLYHTLEAIGFRSKSL